MIGSRTDFIISFINWSHRILHLTIEGGMIFFFFGGSRESLEALTRRNNFDISLHEQAINLKSKMNRLGALI